jgi:hypothetical protein
MLLHQKGHAFCKFPKVYQVQEKSASGEIAHHWPEPIIRPMAGLGQSRQFVGLPVTSGLPRSTDI